MTIGDARYGFDDKGKMYAGSRFWCMDENGTWYYFAAKSNGKLYANEWYIGEYYMDENGRSVMGLYAVNGVLYYFEANYGGQLVRNTTVNVDSQLYTVDENGVATLQGVGTEGWNQVGDDWYYVRNGEYVKSIVMTIGDARYGFDDKGKMYAGSRFWCMDENGTWYYFAAKSNGKLYANEWYIGEYYMDENGRSVMGLYAVNGVLYYFEANYGGQLVRNTTVNVDGHLYTVNENGEATLFDNDGNLDGAWVQVDGKWHYRVDGADIVGRIVKIEGAYYCFDNSGAMYDDAVIEMGDGSWYVAQAGGKLLTNAWRQRGDDWYYFGDSARVVTGGQTIDGQQYFFHDDGRMKTSGLVIIDRTVYGIGSNGLVTADDPQVAAGWQGSYYVIDGEYVAGRLLRIGGAYYAFDGSGMLYQNGTGIYGESPISGEWGYFGAHGDGTLCVSEWYYDEMSGEASYYFGADGRAVTGLQTVDGTRYYFDGMGWKMRGTTVMDNNVLYQMDGAGAVTVYPADADGWKQVGGEWYYVEGGAYVVGANLELSGSYYSFDGSGRMYRNICGFSISSPISGEWGYFAAHSDGTLYISEWWSDGMYEDGAMYFGADGRAFLGLQTVDGVLYYFDSMGWKMRNGSVFEGGKLYVTDETGAATVVSPEPDGWKTAGSGKYYARNGAFVRDQILQIDGKYYAFSYDGRMCRNQMSIWGTSPISGEAGYFCAGDDGTLYISAWFGHECYYGADGRGVSGLVTVDGTTYYFDSTGCIMRNATFTDENGVTYETDDLGVAWRRDEAKPEGWVSVGGARRYLQNGDYLRDQVALIEGDYYAFDDNGALVVNAVDFCLMCDIETYYSSHEDGRLYRNEWLGDRYFGGDCQPVSGLLTVDGVQRYFDSNGYMKRGTQVLVDGVGYEIDADGVATQGDSSTGWTEINGQKYYAVDGAFVKNQMLKIGDSYYYFNDYGVMQCSTTAWATHPDTGVYSVYGFKENGVMCVNEWLWGNCYFGENGVAANGLMTVDDVLHYFDYGSMLTGTTREIDGVIYMMDENGVAAPFDVSQQDGWTEINGQKYYAVDGAFVKNQMLKIGDSYYYFNDYGVMQCSTTAWATHPDTGVYNVYGFKENGVMCVNEWLWGNCYFGENGVAANGLMTVDGVLHYFDYGSMLTGTTREIDGVIYVMDENGVAAPFDVSQQDGWTEINGQKYYAVDGAFVKNQMLKIGDSYYYFNDYGVMQSSTTAWATHPDAGVYSVYGFKENGVMCVNEWLWGNCYFGENGVAANGLTTVDGVLHYFDYGSMLTGTTREIDGITYVIDEYGVATVYGDVSDGWCTVDGYRRYRRNSAYIKNQIAEIGGVLYGFDAVGNLYTGRFTLGGNTYMANADGSLFKGGWYYIDDHSMQYYKDDGTLWAPQFGIQSLNGNYYFFESADTAHRNGESRLYMSDASGFFSGEALVVCREDGTLLCNQWYESTLTNGRYYFGGDGAPLIGIQQVDGETYLFGGYGDGFPSLVTGCRGPFQYGADETGELMCILAEDGRVLTNQWYEDTYYCGPDGHVFTGLQTVDGTLYYFAPIDGWLYRDTTVTVDGVEYLIDADGVATRKDGLTDGWYESSAGKKYMQNGAFLKDEIAEIDGKRYAFGSDCYLCLSSNYDGGLFQIGEDFYASDGDGVLICGGWVTVFEPGTPTPWMGRAYLGADGKMLKATGLQTVDGGLYYFESYENRVVVFADHAVYGPEIDGECAINRILFTGPDGKVLTNQWKEDGEDTYYLDDRGITVFGVYPVNGIYYLFGAAAGDVPTRDYGSGVFHFYDYWHGTDGYCVMEDDVVVINQWYAAEGGYFTGRLYCGPDGLLVDGMQVIGGETYYFGNYVLKTDSFVVWNGVTYILDAAGRVRTVSELSDGWMTIDGNQYYVENGNFLRGLHTLVEETYYFNEQGVLLKDTTVTVDGTRYFLDENGRATDHGWVDENGGRYYQLNGEYVTSRVMEIGGKLYGFDSTGKLYKNAAFTLDGMSYRAKADGTLYAGEWYTASSYTYYYELQGRMVTGLQDIGEDTYYFNTYGQLQKYASFSLDGAYYRTDAGGKLLKNAWSNSCYYGADGKRYSGMREVEGKTYCFGSNGVKLTDTVTAVDGVGYVIDKDGVCTAMTDLSDGWLTVGAYDYYARGGAFLTGLQEIDADCYYFDDNGKLLKNGTEAGYRADADGRVYRNAWHEDTNGNRYYYGADCLLLTNGLYTVEDTLYYFYSNGRLGKNTTVTVNGVRYVLDANGAAAEYTLDGSGWEQRDGDTYYLAPDGEYVKSMVVLIDGSYYGFDQGGIRYENTTFYRNSSYYRAAADGRLYENAWYDEVNGDRYYYGEKGMAANGFVTVDGVLHRFSNGRMQKNMYVSGAEYYYVDGEGVAWLVDQTEDGWQEAGDKTFYVQYGQAVKAQVLRIKGDYYGFDSNGALYQDVSFGINNLYYRAKADGKLYVEEWYESGTSRYYYGEAGKAPSGIQTVDGVQYYFNYYGQMNRSTQATVNGVLYVVDAEGVATAIDLSEDGWRQAGSSRYYVENGALVKNRLLEVEGKTYGFGSSGELYVSTRFYFSGKYYVADETGALYAGKWYKDDSGDWYYYGEDLQPVRSGMYTIGGADYYFDGNGRMYVRRQFSYTVEGVSHYYAASQSGAIVKNDWFQDQNGTYYFYDENGWRVSDEIRKIGNAYYCFDSSGRMRNDVSFSRYDSEAGVTRYYRAKKGGALYRSAWYRDGEGVYYYYDENGWRLSSQVCKIGGSTYGFDSSGRMYDDASFGLYTDSKWTYYRAKKNGALYMSAWYQDEEGTYYYYDENGVQCRGGLRKVGTAWYGFDGSGRMYAERVFSIYDSDTGKRTYYRARKSGALYISTWYRDEDGAYYYYDENCVQLTGCVKEFGSVVYGFDGSGRMYDDTSFSVRDGETDTRKYYRAKKGGALYRGEWYRFGSESSSTAYYGADGAVPEGILTLDGVTYIFFEGRLMRNGAWKEDGGYYLTDGQGLAHAVAAGDGWKSLEGAYFYVRDGEFVKNEIRVLIGSAFYGFSSDGSMYNDTNMSATDPETGTYEYFRYKPGGALCVNAWYQDDGGWSYYGEQGRGLKGLQTLDGKTYYFSNGRMQVNTAIESEGNFYVANKDGLVTTVSADSGWKKVDGCYYYIQDGAFLKNTVARIGGSLYGFASSGRMRDGETFDLYDSGLGRWVYYRAASGGALYENSWVEEESGNRYYYGEGGAAPSGLTTLDGVLYSFESSGRMRANEADLVDGVNYVFLSSGEAVDVGAAPGWVQKEGKWYYIQADGAVISQRTIVKIGGSYYGFSDYGWMYVGASFGAYDDDADQWRYYRAKASGALYVNEWVNGHYYGEGGAAYPQGTAAVIDGQRYLFPWSDGQMGRECILYADGDNYIADEFGLAVSVGTQDGWRQQGSYWYYVKNGKAVTNQSLKIGGSLYFFSENGWMVSGSDQWWGYTEDRANGMFSAKPDGTLYVSQWVLSSGYEGDAQKDYWYYYGADGRAVMGEQLINGVKYFFDENGRLLEGGAARYRSVDYRKDENGQIVVLSAPDGWLKLDGNWYYVRQNKVVRSEVIKVGGSYYGFSSMGVMQTGCAFDAPVRSGNTSTWGWFRAKKSGELYTGWYNAGHDVWYYYGASGMAARGVETVDGKAYGFNSEGQMLRNAAFNWNGKIYKTDASGVASVITPANGKWYQQGGDCYYVENGLLVTDTVMKISGQYYYFNSDGRMYTNGIFGTENSTYAAKANGALYVNSWLKQGETWYYFGADAKGLSGVHEIDGKTCVFQNGRMLNQGVVCVNGKNYYVDKDGNATEITDAVTGWKKYDSVWYYLREGRFITGGIAKLGSTYGFDSMGRLAANASVYGVDYSTGGSGSYRTKADGTVYISGWYQSGNDWYYYGADGRAADGIVTVGGKTYGFRSGRMIADGAMYWQRNNYYMNASGIASTMGTKDGWQSKNGKWYYIRGGRLLSSAVAEIGGSLYGFDTYGRMRTNEVVAADYVYDSSNNISYRTLYYVDASGKADTAQGWLTLSDGGRIYKGTGGVLYVSGTYTIDGKAYTFDSNGRLVN